MSTPVRHLNITVNTTDGSVPSYGTATAQIDTDNVILGAEFVEPGRLQVSFPVCAIGNMTGWGVVLNISAGGYQFFSEHCQTVPDGNEVEGNAVTLTPASLPFPDAPSRETLCTSTLSFQGLAIPTHSYGLLNWFEVISWDMPLEDRDDVYAAKLNAGDTAIIFDLSGNYCGPNFCYPVSGKDWTQDLYGMRQRICEAIRAGFPNVWLFLAGDGMSNPNGGYNDPVGWTYGYEWLMANLQRIITSLQPLDGADPSSDDARDLTQYILFCPGYDGVFYGWGNNPNDCVEAFGKLFRSILPNGYLAIEHTTGNIPIGNGPADYAPGGSMQNFDVIFSEFDNQPTPDNDSYWQVAARLLGPAYVRPPDQPSWDDPPPAPFYLKYPTPRGPFYANALEYYAYPWVRKAVTTAQVEAKRQAMRGLGYTLVG